MRALALVDAPQHSRVSFLHDGSARELINLTSSAAFVNGGDKFWAKRDQSKSVLFKEVYSFNPNLELKKKMSDTL